MTEQTTEQAESTPSARFCKQQWRQPLAKGDAVRVCDVVNYLPVPDDNEYSGVWTVEATPRGERDERPPRAGRPAPHRHPWPARQAVAPPASPSGEERHAMSDRPRVTLVAIDPAGRRHTVRTAAGYTWAAFAFVGAPDGSGAWKLVAVGWTSDSVLARGRAATSWTSTVELVRLTLGRPDAVPPVVARYFAGVGRGRPVVRQVFAQGQGWLSAGPGQRCDAAWLRTLPDNVTAVQVEAGGRAADFARDELYAS